MKPATSVECMEILLKANNADIDVEDNFKRTPLFVAVESGNIEMVKFLIQKGANVNHINALGESIIFQAALKHHMNTTMVLKEAGGTFTSDDIFSAFRKRDYTLLNTMKTAGADFTIGDHEGYTCLHAAAWEGRKDVVEWILDNTGLDVNVKNNGGATPLHEAARWGRIEMIEFLVQRGACVNAKAYEDSTPLHWAISFEEFKVADMLQTMGGVVVSHEDQ